MRLLSRWGCSQGLSTFIPGESSRSFPPGTLGIVWLKGDGAENPGLWTRVLPAERQQACYTTGFQKEVLAGLLPW